MDALVAEGGTAVQLNFHARTLRPRLPVTCWPMVEAYVKGDVATSAKEKSIGVSLVPEVLFLTAPHNALPEPLSGELHVPPAGTSTEQIQ